MTSRQTAVPAGEPPRPAGHLSPPPPAPCAGRLPRPLPTAPLIAGVLVGLRGAFTLHGWHGPYRRDGIAIGVTLEVDPAGLLDCAAGPGAPA